MREEFVEKFQLNWQSTLSPKQARNKLHYSFNLKRDDLGDLKLSEIPEDSFSSRLNSPQNVAINNIMSKKKE